ncbi:hypothetical protein WKI71_35035 [Streptomyces sp. MS1.AVA.1]|uniref:Uncharacterized protein n=1 Tax=Streptomyces machairae TaxID=3134109 RepID=A0ABU8US05_9ACTN
MSGTRPVRIVAALVNPRGPAPEAETVTLLNASPAPVDLTGRHLQDRLAGFPPCRRDRSRPAPASPSP